jgi:hypothetical protein
MKFQLRFGIGVDVDPCKYEATGAFDAASAPPISTVYELTFSCLAISVLTMFVMFGYPTVSVAPPWPVGLMVSVNEYCDPDVTILMSWATGGNPLDAGWSFHAA